VKTFNFNKEMKTKGFVLTVLTSVIVAMVAVYAYSRLEKHEVKVITTEGQQKMVYANIPQEANQVPDFTYAAEKAIHAVVHVKTKSTRSYSYNPFFFFWGERPDMEPEPQMGFGSGVIISTDGYIVTNNHVIDKSEEIEVVLNDRRSFTAKVIGTDKDTDLALIKIEAKDLAVVPYGNSDDLKLGQWVLAIGNPYNLTSTVTAGIVSAKARNINILSDRRTAIESFIQTDAAVNPGNSGGALVNTRGELVGINAAIASTTGSYVGNSFAIPVNIVKKVVGDLTEYGAVQRAVLGVEISEITQELAKEKKIDKLEGVYVGGIRENGAALDAGIKEGDVIMSVNNVPVNSPSELQEQISRYRPNDKVNVLIRRDNKDKMFSVTLRNMSGNTQIVKKGETTSVLGASFEEISQDDKRELGIKYGVRVVTLEPGKLLKSGVKEGFIITHVNNKPVSSVDELENFLSKTKGGVLFEGIYPDGMKAYYAIGM